jgi:predicted dehydrogenase
MISAADRAGVNLMYAQTHRFSPENMVVKGLIDDGAIGDVIWITWTRLGPGYPGSERWSRRTETGGGFLTYEGPHIIDQFRWLAGSDLDAAVTIGMGRFASGGDGEDAILGGFRLKSGAFVAMIEGRSNPNPRYTDWRILGTEGMIEIAGHDVRLGKDDWSTVPIPDLYDPPPPDIDRLREVRGFPGFHVEFKEFVDSIREGRRPSCTGEDGKAALEGGLALRRSGRTGQTVPLPLD